MDLDTGTGTRNADKSPAQNIGQTAEDESQLQRTDNQQPPNAMSRPAGKPLATSVQLLLLLRPQLDKDKAMQLQRLYIQLRSQSINKKEFFRHLRSLVGDDMVKMAIYKIYQQGLLPIDPRIYNKCQKRRLLEHESESHGVHASHESSNVDAIKQERGQQQSHGLQMRKGLVHTAFSDMKRLHRGGLARFTIKSGKLSIAYAKQEPSDQINDHQHKSLLSAPQGPSSISLGQIESSKDGTFEMMSSKPGFSNSVTEPEPMSITAQLERLNVSAGNSSLVSGCNAKTSPKKPTVGQEIKFEAPVSLLRKKQKVFGAFSDQQLNDVTAVSGMHLRVQDVRAELEKEQEAQQNLEKRLEKMERDREQERVEQVEREKKVQKQFDEVMKKLADL